MGIDCNDSAGECFEELKERTHCCEQFERTPCDILVYDGCTCIKLRRECYTNCDYVGIRSSDESPGMDCDCCRACIPLSGGSGNLCGCIDSQLFVDGGCIKLTIHKLDAIAKFDDPSKIVINYSNWTACHLSESNQIERCSSTIRFYRYDPKTLQLNHEDITFEAYCAQLPVTYVFRTHACTDSLTMKYEMVKDSAMLLRATHDYLGPYTSGWEFPDLVQLSLNWNLQDLGCGGAVRAKGTVCVWTDYDKKYNDVCEGNRCDQFAVDDDGFSAWMYYQILDHDPVFDELILSDQMPPPPNPPCFDPLFGEYEYDITIEVVGEKDQCRNLPFKQSLPRDCCLRKPRLTGDRYVLSFDDSGRPTLIHYDEHDEVITVWSGSEKFDGIHPTPIGLVHSNGDEQIRACACLIPVYTYPAQDDIQCDHDGEETCRCHIEVGCDTVNVIIRDCNGEHSISMIRYRPINGTLPVFGLDPPPPAPDYYCALYVGSSGPIDLVGYCDPPPGYGYGYFVVVYCTGDSSQPWEAQIYCVRYIDQYTVLDYRLTNAGIISYTQLCNGFVFDFGGDIDCAICCCVPLTDEECNLLQDEIEVIVTTPHIGVGNGTGTRSGCTYTGSLTTDMGVPIYFILDLANCQLRFSCNSPTYEYIAPFDGPFACNPNYCIINVTFTVGIPYGSCFGSIGEYILFNFGYGNI